MAQKLWLKSLLSINFFFFPVFNKIKTKMPAYENLFPAYLYIYKIKLADYDLAFYGITADFFGLPEYLKTADSTFLAYELLAHSYSIELIAEGEYKSYDEVQYFYNWHIRHNKCINLDDKYTNTEKLNKLFENKTDKIRCFCEKKINKDEFKNHLISHNLLAHN